MRGNSETWFIASPHLQPEHYKSARCKGPSPDRVSICLRIVVGRSNGCRPPSERQASSYLATARLQNMPKESTYKHRTISTWICLKKQCSAPTRRPRPHAAPNTRHPLASFASLRTQWTQHSHISSSPARPPSLSLSLSHPIASSSDANVPRAHPPTRPPLPYTRQSRKIMTVPHARAASGGAIPSAQGVG